MNNLSEKIEYLKIKSDLFKDVKCFFSGTLIPSIQKCLENGGATIQKFTMDHANYVICGKQYEETHIQEAHELYDIPVVNENWVLASAKLGRLAFTKAYDLTSNKLFANCIFTFNQIESQDQKKLYAMITFNAGTVQKNFDKNVTHLVCGSAQDIIYNKAVCLNKSSLTIVTPDWIIDSLKQKSIANSEIYHPRLLLSPDTRDTPTKSTNQMSQIISLDSVGKIKEDNNIQQQSTPSTPQQNPTTSFSIRGQTPLSGPQRPQLQARPVVQTSMQHTTAQINQILQSQIQKQQKLQTQNQLQSNQSQINQVNLPPQNPTSLLQQHAQKAQAQSQSNNSFSASNQAMQQKQLQQLQSQQQQLSDQKPESRIIPTINQTPQQNRNQSVLSHPQSQKIPDTLEDQQSQAPVSGQQIQFMTQQQQLQKNQQMLINQQNPNNPSIGAQVQNPHQAIVGNNQQQMNFLNQSTIQSNPQQQMSSGQQQYINFKANPQQQANPQQPQAQHQIILNNPQSGVHQIMPNQQKNISQQSAGTPGQQSGNSYVQIIQQGQQIIQIQQHGTQQQKLGNIQQHPQQMNPTGNQTVVNQQNPQQIVPGNQIPSGNLQNQQIVIINQQGQQSNVGSQHRFQILQNPQSQQNTIQKSNQIVNTGATTQIQQQKLMKMQGNQMILNQSGNQQPNQQIIQLPGDVSADQKLIMHNQQTQQQQAVQQIVQQLQNQTENLTQTPVIQGEHAVNQPVQLINQNQMIAQQSYGANNPQNINVQRAPQGAPKVPQSPNQQGGAQPQMGQQQAVQQIITTNQGELQTQFVRASGPRYMYLDAQSSLQFQRMDAAQKQEYLEKRGILMSSQQQIAFNARPGTIQQGPRPQQIIIQSHQLPTGMSRTQQIQWLQNQRAPVVIRHASANQQNITAIGGSQIVGAANQFGANPVQFQVDQLQKQQQFQRLQQFQLKSQQQQVQQSSQAQQSHQMTDDPSQVIANPGYLKSEQNVVDPNLPGNQINKTKTALANLLNTRLGNNGNVVLPIVEQNVGEPSASGTLRLMSQHNASMNATQPTIVRHAQELLVIQQQKQQLPLQNQQKPQPPQPTQQMQIPNHQRRTLGNITNATPIPPAAPGSVNQINPGGVQIVIPQSPGAIKVTSPFSPGRAPLARPQFYGHNPNLKLPNDLFLLGCHFLIVEYDETNKDDLPAWKKIIINYGGEIETCFNPKITHILCRSQKHGIVMQAIRENKRCVTAYWLSDIVMKRQVLPPWQSIHLPTPSLYIGCKKPGHKHIICITSFEDEERERIKQMVLETGARLTTYLNRQNTVMICKKVDMTNKKCIKAKELGIPMVNAVWLSDLLLGNTSQILQYENAKYQSFTITQPLRIDYTIVSHLMNAWKAPINLHTEAHEKLKRSQFDPPPVKVKRMRTLPPLEALPNQIICRAKPEKEKSLIIMFSCIDKDNETKLTQSVVALGGSLTENPTEMTHLVMTRPLRTMKYMYALCCAKHILTSKWLVESANNGYFLPEEDFDMREVEYDGLKINMRNVLKSNNRSKLFEGRIFFITPSVKPFLSHLRSLIELCGGKVENNRRSILKIQETNNFNENSYIIISCPQDMHLITSSFKQFVCQVCTSEFIMHAIVTQTLNFSAHSIKYI